MNQRYMCVGSPNGPNKIRHPICLCEELEEEIRFEGMEEGTTQ